MEFNHHPNGILMGISIVKPARRKPARLQDIFFTTSMWGPPVISWFINPMNTIVIGIINHSEMGGLFTNLAIANGGPTLMISQLLLVDDLHDIDM